MSVSRGKRVLKHRVYLLPEHRLPIERVNSDTMWKDRVWRFRRKRKDVLVDWGSGLREQEWLSDDWQRLINLGRRLILAEIDGAVDTALDLLTIATRRAPLLYFLRWMLKNDYYDISELDSQACAYYRDDLEAEKIDHDDPGESVSTSTLAGYLDVPLRFFRHRTVFRDFPDMVLSQSPYGGMSARAVASEVIVENTQHIPRVPVEVQNAVLPVAQKWIWDYSDDVLNLQAAFVDARNAGAHYTGNSYMYYTNRALQSYRFASLDGTHQPWRPPIESEATITRHSDGEVTTKCYRPGSQFRMLLNDLRDAAVITLQGLAGMRISDVGEFQVEPRQPDGLPHCLVRKRSVTGLFEMYFARGRVAKGGSEDDEPDEEWLLGSHPVGSNTLPDAVKAMLVLDDLFKPWRKISGSTSLIVSLGRGLGPPRMAREQPEVLLETLRRGQISFVANNVTLPESYAGWQLSTHQWRSGYAQDIITINDGLLPAVQEQFKQLSRAVLETAYIGSSPYFNRLLADQRSHSTGEAMYAIIQGSSIATGETEEDIRELTENLGKIVARFPTEEKKKSALRRMCEEEGITLWGQAYGDCLFRGATSRCHQQQHGKFDPNAKRPLVMNVCAELCAGCSNLVISTRHRKYWLDRRDEFLDALQKAKADDNTAFETLCRSHLHVATRILERLDAAQQNMER